MNYNFNEIESKWQEYWSREKLFKAPEHPKNKFYLLEMYPYPSGEPHMGHLKNYVVGDTVARIKHMEGYEVLHPMGWDAFGLPAENAAIQRKLHPKEWVQNNIGVYKKAFKLLGISYDWDREISTHSSDYYRWTQWLFLFLYKKKLAYRKKEYVNWCPKCNTVLANEQVVEGRCERCRTLVTKKLLTQWFFKVTEYAERLLQDLKKLRGRWPDKILKLQENWIGKKEGTEIVFGYKANIKLPVFTTRADTIFGVTFLTLAPEHPLIPEIIKGSEYKHQVERYIEEAIKRPDIERARVERKKSGVFTGEYAIHPFTKEKIPIWIGDYVLINYGTGIVMGVPAHDQRDFEFAQRYNLPIKLVVKPENGEPLEPVSMKEAFEDYGVMVNSGEFNGLPSQKGIKMVEEKLKEDKCGGRAVSYAIKDWLISRQRYWGTPIPIVYCKNCGVVPVPAKDLPVLLPTEVKSFIPKGRSPLEDISEFMITKCPQCKGEARRDPDTMDTFVDSSWYYLRFIDPKNEKEPFDKQTVLEWMPVDQYIGGAEHATKHLIYARFIAKVLYDEKIIPYDEPFQSLFNQGLVHKKFFWCKNCLKRLAESEAEKNRHKECGGEIEERLEMMSSSRGNVVPVTPFVEKNGADVTRITILFAGPAEKDMEWTEAGVEGAKRFIRRIWSLFSENAEHIKKIRQIKKDNLNPKEKELYRTLHHTIKGVREDSSRFHFNTAIAKLMELLNKMYAFPDKKSDCFSYTFNVYLMLLAPFAPHLAEELWNKIGYEKSILLSSLPEPDIWALEEELSTIIIQVNGRVKGKITVSKGLSKEKVKEMAILEKSVEKYIKGKKIIKTIYVPEKILNLVVE